MRIPNPARRFFLLCISATVSVLLDVRDDAAAQRHVPRSRRLTRVELKVQRGPADESLTPSPLCRIPGDLRYPIFTLLLCIVSLR